MINVVVILESDMPKLRPIADVNFNFGKACRENFGKGRIASYLARFVKKGPQKINKRI